jgi:tRNA A-37 threonylcarbamoyl transferase component Bud32
MTINNPTHPKCFDREILADFTLGKLPVAEIERITAELETCPACQSTLDMLADLEDSVVADLRSGAAQGVGRLHAELEPQIREAEQIGRRVWGQPKPEVPGEPSPKFLGQYEILEQIGQGGMGRVYKALHTRLKRLVAVKLLPAQRLADPQAVARFQREVEAVGRLNHPNIVQALDANELDGQHFLVTEFVDGTDLSRLVRSGGRLPVPDACEIVRQAALGLQHAHEHGLVHRDVKPSNLMLSSTGIVKLLDLGLARLRPETPIPADVTVSGQVMGSADYMAPEQCLDAREVDAQADIYSLGCTLYFLLVGRPPFAGPQYDTVGKKLLAHAQETVPPIQRLRNDIPPSLVVILERMLAKHPENRPVDAANVAATVAPLAAGADLPTLLARPQGNAGKGENLDPGCCTQPPAVAFHRGHGRQAAVLTAMLVCLIAAILGGPPVVRWLQSRQRPAVAGENHSAVVAVPSEPKAVSVAAIGLPGRRDGDEDAGSRAASAYLARAEVLGPAREAMQTVLRQHPDESRWSGRNGSTLFAIAVRRLPGGMMRQQAGPAFLNLTHMLAVQELLKAKSLLDRYAESGLTDATTLRQAVVQAAGNLEVAGKVRGFQHQATAQDDFAVAYVLADESALSAHLLQPVSLGRVQAAYRDVMHAQARDLMRRSNWKDALLLWQHLHARKLVSPGLYLDAARCFKELGQDSDVVRVLDEAIRTLGPKAGPEFLERAGDLALAIQTEAAQKLAEQAYRGASETLKEQVSPPDVRADASED